LTAARLLRAVIDGLDNIVWPSFTVQNVIDNRAASLRRALAFDGRDFDWFCSIVLPRWNLFGITEFSSL
jgi:hypothetical protein